MAEDGFKNKPNCGVPQEDLKRGYSHAMPEDDGFGIIGYGDYVGEAENMPLFKGGFAGRPMGWER